VSKPIRCLDTFWVLLRAFLCFHDLVPQGIESVGSFSGSGTTAQRIALNDQLTRIIQGRTIGSSSKKGNWLRSCSTDHSTMRVKVVGGPTVNVSREGKIKSVCQEGLELYIDCEDGTTATLRLAESGSSVSVTDKAGRVEYSG
jgi:hypothetical protein